MYHLTYHTSYGTCSPMSLRSDEQGTPDVEVLVIGAGLAGLWAAIELQKHGLAFLIVVLASIWRLVFGAGLIVAFGVMAITAVALMAGHFLGGPAKETRTAVAISSALRNPGLALLVATSNHAPTEVSATIFAYLIWAAAATGVYIATRRR